MDPDLPQNSPKSRKVKFAPKGPPRRKKQNLLKTEEKEDINDNEAAEAILRRVNERLTRQKPKAEKRATEVTFGHGVASPTSIRTFGKPRGLAVNRDGTRLKDPESDDRQDASSLAPSSSIGTELAVISVNNSDAVLKRKEYKEPWDYHHSNYPTTLPVRRPYAGDPEILDRAEFGAAAVNAKYDEKNINPASELGLLEKKDEPQILLFQLPAILPLGRRQASTGGKDTAGCFALPVDKCATSSSPMLKGKEAADSPRLPPSAKGKEIVDSSTISRRPNTSTKVCSLEQFPEGYMGKMLVYKSGAIKFKLGDILYDVRPGQEGYFSQDVVAINTVEKQFCQLGELGKRALVEPDVDYLVDNLIKLGKDQSI